MCIAEARLSPSSVRACAAVPSAAARPLLALSVACCESRYCQCFAMQVVCTASCNCHHCYNNANQESMRLQAINGVLERNPAAFDAKFRETEVDGSIVVGDQRCKDNEIIRVMGWF